MPDNHKRKYQRFPVDLDGAYTLEDSDTKNPCKIKNISREGTLIEFYAKTETRPHSLINLEITVPGNNQCIKTVVMLMWIKELESGSDFRYDVGGRFTVINLDDKWNLLDYAYDCWRSHH